VPGGVDLDREGARWLAVAGDAKSPRVRAQSIEKLGLGGALRGDAVLDADGLDLVVRANDEGSECARKNQQQRAAAAMEPHPDATHGQDAGNVGCGVAPIAARRSLSATGSAGQLHVTKRQTNACTR